jgi:hypothetical protein
MYKSEGKSDGKADDRLENLRNIIFGKNWRDKIESVVEDIDTYEKLLEISKKMTKAYMLQPDDKRTKEYTRNKFNAERVKSSPRISTSFRKKYIGEIENNYNGDRYSPNYTPQQSHLEHKINITSSRSPIDVKGGGFEESQENETYYERNDWQKLQEFKIYKNIFGMQRPFFNDIEKRKWFMGQLKEFYPNTTDYITLQLMDREQEMVEKRKMNFFDNRITDFMSFELDNAIQLLEILQQIRGTAVIHCSAGFGRTGSVMMLYMLYQMHKDRFLHLNQPLFDQFTRYELFNLFDYVYPQNIDGRNNTTPAVELFHQESTDMANLFFTRLNTAYLAIAVFTKYIGEICLYELMEYPYIPDIYNEEYTANTLTHVVFNISKDAYSGEDSDIMSDMYGILIYLKKEFNYERRYVSGDSINDNVEKGRGEKGDSDKGDSDKGDSDKGDSDKGGNGFRKTARKMRKRKYKIKRQRHRNTRRYRRTRK